MFTLRENVIVPGYGRQCNEDAIGWGKDYCFCMDGASCLSGAKVLDPQSDAAWMTRKIKKALCAALDGGDSRPTGEILAEILAPLRETYLSACGENIPTDSPSAGIALFRKRAGKLEFFGLGDCLGMAKIHGEIFSSRDENLPKLDGSVLQEIIRLRSQGYSKEQAMDAVREKLLYNRSLRNTPAGYWVLDLLTYREGIENAREFTWELDAPVAVFACSDGFSQLTDTLHQYPDYPALFGAVRQQGIAPLFEKMCRIQDQDPDLLRYPRFKHRDDTCALWGAFSLD